MTIRTTQTRVTFTRPFVLSELEGEQPAGVYDIETDEERLEGLSFSAYRRVQTLIHLHPKTGNPSLIQTMRIDPEALAAALQRDQAPAAMLAIQDDRNSTVEEASHKNADREAVERGEDEGNCFSPLAYSLVRTALTAARMPASSLRLCAIAEQGQIVERMIHEFQAARTFVICGGKELGERLCFGSYLRPDLLWRGQKKSFQLFL
jgi:hypothetical protein